MVIELADPNNDDKLNFKVDEGDKFVYLSIESVDKMQSIEVSYIELKSAVLSIEQLIKK